MFYCCAVTEQGVKERNEDAVLIDNIVLTEGTVETEITKPFIAAVCDGVSGEKSGDIASKMCLAELAKQPGKPYQRNKQDTQAPSALRHGAQKLIEHADHHMRYRGG